MINVMSIIQLCDYVYIYNYVYIKLYDAFCAFVFDPIWARIHGCTVQRRRHIVLHQLSQWTSEAPEVFQCEPSWYGTSTVPLQEHSQIFLKRPKVEKNMVKIQPPPTREQQFIMDWSGSESRVPHSISESETLLWNHRVGTIEWGPFWDQPIQVRWSCDFLNDSQLESNSDIPVRGRFSIL